MTFPADSSSANVKTSVQLAGFEKIKHVVMPNSKRYIILFLFCFNAGNKAFQWIQIPASTKKVTYYYGVENYVINSTSVVFMLSFIILSLPACYLIEHIGLRRAVLVGSFGTAVGSVIKCYSCHESGIYMLFAGQIIVSLSEQFVFSVPNRLASVWFPDHQVSSAVALSVVGSQLGVALGFLAPQVSLDGAETKEQIGAGLYRMFFYTALVSCLALLADLLLFDEAPKFAPGEARLKQIEEESKRRQSALSFRKEMGQIKEHTGRLVSNRDFNLLALSYGINVGVCYAFCTLLDQMLVSTSLELDAEQVAGTTGFLYILSGALVSPFWGQLLDRLHNYLFMNSSLTVASILSLGCFAYVISYTQATMAIYVAAILFGLFQTGVLVAGLELAVELTYPSPELITSSLMNIPPQVFGIAMVFVASHIVDTYGPLAANSFFLASFAIALILLLTIKETLKRQNAVLEKTSRQQMKRNLDELC